MASPLAKHHEDLVDRLASADLETLSRECAEIKVIPKNVKKSMEYLDPGLPLPRKIRYLLLHAYEKLEGNPRLYGRWLEVLSSHGVSDHLATSTCQPSQNGNRAESACFMKKHVPALTEMLAGNSSRWYDIGVSLYLPQNDLKRIAAQALVQPGNPFIFSLIQVLNEWVCGGHEHAKPPTVESLRETLGSMTVGLGKEASKLQENLVKNGICFKEKAANKSHDVDAPLLEIVRQSCDIKIAQEKSTLLEVQTATAHETAISYRWMKDDCLLDEDDKYFIGTHKEILCINNVMLASKGTYTCETKIRTKYGQTVVVLSEPIVLTVDLAPTTEVLVKVYSSPEHEIQKNAWPPRSNKTYVDLALVKQEKTDITDYSIVQGDVDDIKKERESVEYAEVFGEYRSGTLLLIEGRPGSGKTTLVRKVTSDWASGKFILKGAKLVLLISLRALSKNMDASMLDILKSVYHTNDTICSALLCCLEECYGEGVCLILDGLDEYVRDERHESTIFNIIQKNYLQQSMIIVASRQIAANELRGVADTSVEVIGFLKEQILDYVKNYPFPRHVSAEELKSYLTEHPNILRMCYLPVHASMISFLYCQIQDLPETESGIYKYFTLFTVLRKLKSKRSSLESLDDLEGNDKEQFNKICKLAFDMTASSQQVFGADELSSDTNADEPSLGLVTIDFTASVFGMDKLYSFFHLTFQEFLAAYYISKLEKEKQVEAIGKYGKEKQMKVVWKLFCGLVNFQGRGFKFEEVLKLHDDGLFHCQCAFESQQPSTCRSVVLFGGSSGGLAIKNQRLNPSDFTSIGYVTSNASEIFEKLTLRNCNLGDDASVLACADVLKPCINLQSLDLSNNSFGDHGATTLACRIAKFKSLLTLNLPVNKISEVGVRALADSLKHCKSLECLNLEANRIGDDGVRTLSDALHQCSTLHSLNIASNDIGDNGVPPITEILKQCSSLRSLDFSVNQFSPTGMASLARGLKNCQDLQTLNLEWTKIDDICAQVLSENLSGKLQFLNLKNTKISQDGLVTISDCLKSCTMFQELRIIWCNVDDVIAKALADSLSHSCDLHRVDLSWNNIGNEGAKALAENLGKYQDLKKLDLSENAVRDDGIKYLVDHFPLAKVYIYGNTIGTLGARAIAINLKQYCHLETLDLSNCCVTGEGAAAIAEGLTYCISLVTLDLQDNDINVVGAEALAKGLRGCISLVLLDLSINVLGDPGATALAECLQHCRNLESVHLGDNQIGDDGAYALAVNLKHCEHLQSLLLPNNRISEDSVKDLTKHLKGSKCLKQLDLKGNEISCGHGVSAVTKITNSSTLNLNANKLGDDGTKKLAESLRHCRNLEKLELSDNEIGDDGVKFLAANLKHCRKLKCLSLSKNCIGDTGSCELARELKWCASLEVLYLQHNQIDDVGAMGLAEGLKHCSNLRVLFLSNNKIGSNGAKGLAECLKHCVETLHLEHNRIGDNGAESLLKDLNHCINLETLFLGDNHISDVGAKGLARSLNNCSNLRTLSLRQNQIGDDGTMALAEGLKVCSKFTTLYLGHNQIGNDGARDLVAGLKHCSKFRTLSVPHNQIGADGVRGLAEPLRNCTNLQTCELDVNEIGDEGAKALAACLKNSTSLRYLELASNNIGDDGTKALAESLGNASDFLSLNLAHNEIGDEGAEALGEHLKCCGTLELLKLEGNKIGDDGAMALAEGLKHCRNLWVLRLEENNISDEAAETVSEVLEYCLNLTM